MATDKRPTVIGIYGIEHVESGRFYIGSTESFYRRKTHHIYKLRRGIHHSPHLQHAWNKYGEDAFEFYVLEECARDDLLSREQAYLDAFAPVFNVCLIAGRVSSPEVNARRAASLKARAATITHCPRGHVYDAENTLVNKKGKRICRVCAYLRNQETFKTESPADRQKRSDRMRRYYQLHRERLLARQLAYQLRHKDEKREYDQQYRHRVKQGP